MVPSQFAIAVASVAAMNVPMMQFPNVVVQIKSLVPVNAVFTIQVAWKLMSLLLLLHVEGGLDPAHHHPWSRLTTRLL